MRNSRARITLTLSYAGFLVVTGAAVLAGVYVVIRFLPGYPLITEDPSQEQNITSRGEIIGTFVSLSLWLMLGFVVIGLVGGWFLSGRILRPLRTIEEGARRIAEGDLDHRLRLDTRKDEFGEVARSFDTMVDRLEATLAAQRRFAANASHELRTPLSTMSVLLESATQHPEQTDAATLVRALSAENTRAITLMEALLRLHAAGGRDTSADDVVDLTALAREIAVPLTGQDPETIGPPAIVIADPLLLRQLIENLIRNAVQHGAGGVRVTTESSGMPGAGWTGGVHAASGVRGAGWVSGAHGTGGAHGAPGYPVTPPPAGDVVLTVENDGERLDQATLARLTEPLFRRSGRAQHPTEGVGLGLALVEQIVQTHGGSLSFTSPPSGGLRVQVSLPGAPAG